MILLHLFSRRALTEHFIGPYLRDNIETAAALPAQANGVSERRYDQVLRILCSRRINRTRNSYKTRVRPREIVRP